MKSLKLNRGFTLIELMIVMTVIAILAAMVVFGLGAAQKRARDVQRTQIMKSVQNILTAYYGDKGTYPAAAAWGNAAGNLFDASATPSNLGPYSSALFDPGCGSAANTIDVRGNAAPCVPVVYAYIVGAGVFATTGCPAGTPYHLRLTKESGGDAYFCGPQ